MNFDREQSSAVPPKQYASLYANMEDEGSPPPDNGIPLSASRKRQAKPWSNNTTKHKREPKTLKVQSEVQTDDDPQFLKGPVVVFFLAEEQAEAKATPVGKPTRSRARTCTRPPSDTVSEYDSEENLIVNGTASNSDSAHGGRSDPNMSGIIPPLPSNLVEPDPQGFETGFHIVTAGTEVGISVYKGIADSHLDCNKPSTHTFNTWKKAQAYYRICFEASYVHIREPLAVQPPILSLARKKTKIQAPISWLPAPRQPNFALTMKINTPNNPSASSTRNTQCSNCDLIAQATNRHSHHGFQETALSPQPNTQPHGQESPSPRGLHPRIQATALSPQPNTHPHGQATALSPQPNTQPHSQESSSPRGLRPRCSGGPEPTATSIGNQTDPYRNT